eukprot:CAMPEP_0175802056 /NCGR_PEP_ID=MMETSP0097-20121207/87847_1 /TAXON_ID=311494 /ORGANISM="Alexandrium monilatum, Strain CCMP3105" /LENGTH=113 /DNA_ID=CAMNT_0017113387 /DNA_START=236 /DNA_END=574 /DNA_ORIENTATION=-
MTATLSSGAARGGAVASRLAYLGRRSSSGCDAVLLREKVPNATGVCLSHSVCARAILPRLRSAAPTAGLLAEEASSAAGGGRSPHRMFGCAPLAARMLRPPCHGAVFAPLSQR